MAKIENNSTNYVADSISTEKNSKADKMKQAQKEKVASLFERLEEQRKVFYDTKKSYYQTKFRTSILENRTERYQTNTFLKDKYEEKYKTSEMSLGIARKSRDTELSKLQMYTDNFCSANNASIFSI